MQPRAAKLKQLQEEEKMLTTLLEKVNEQLNSLRTEELVIRYHLKTSENTFQPDLPCTAIEGEVQEASELADESNKIVALNLEVGDVLRSLAHGGKGTKRGADNVEEEEEDDDDREPCYNSNDGSHDPLT